MLEGFNKISPTVGIVACESNRYMMRRVKNPDVYICLNDV